MRVLTITEKNRTVPEARTTGKSDTNVAISSSAHVTKDAPLSQLSTPGLCDHSDLEKTVEDVEATCVAVNQISESLKAVFQSTQYAVTSADGLLYREFAQVCQDISKAGFQIQQLKSSAARTKGFKKRTTDVSAKIKRASKFEDLDSRRNDQDRSDSAVIDVFFDCVSRFCSHNSDPSKDNLRVNLFMSPEYRFELLPSFYPEQYVSEGFISNNVFAVAMLPSMDSQQTFRYFLNYAERARRWQRVVVFAAFHGQRQDTNMLHVASSNNRVWGAPEALPSAVHSLLRTLLPSIEFYSTVTKISLDLRMGEMVRSRLSRQG